MIADRLRTSWGEILKTVKTVFLSADDRRRQKAEISSQHALSVVISRTEHNVPGLRHSHNESYHFIPLPIHHTLSLVTTHLFLINGVSSLCTCLDYLKCLMYSGHFRSL